ncbi:hypothetical protein ACFPRL_32720 [Pseudoclavibacter helvolus]
MEGALGDVHPRELLGAGVPPDALDQDRAEFAEDCGFTYHRWSPPVRVP